MYLLLPANSFYKVTNIDIPSFRYYVNYEIFLYGQGLVSPWAPRTPLQEVELAFGEQVRLFPAGKSLPSVDVTYTISEGGMSPRTRSHDHI